MSSPRQLRTTKMNKLQQQMQASLKGALGVLTLLFSTWLTAATPLNDQELDKNFVTGGVPSDPSGAVFKQIVTLADIKPSPLAIIPVNDLTALFSLLDNQQNKLIEKGGNPYWDGNSFGEIASYGFGSEFYSYRWADNYNQIYNPANFQYYYFNTVSGYMEIDNNIRGRVEIEGSIHAGNKTTQSFRSSYVFN